MRTFYRFLALASILVICLGPAAFAQKSGSISGTVKDSQTGEPLPGANVLIVKTSLGGSTDVDGRYNVREVPPGTYTLRATYVGYKQKEIAIEVQEGQALKQDFKLLSVGVEGEEVVVTAQAAGQKGAINQQLASMPVMNVVSAARIQELPDVNAAESVSRLPGVSLIRTGGEGSKVVVRGLSPQYNQVTIDGVELSSNVNSQNSVVSGDANQGTATPSLLGDRGMDLSMISSSMLGGIEVIKAITPDMDASVLGGVVNFDMRKAAKETESFDGGTAAWIPHFDLGTQVGYNKLRDTYGNYRFVGSVEKRFIDNKLGFFLQGTKERRNLSANELAAGYTLYDRSHGDAGVPEIDQLNMTDVNRSRQRVGGTLVIDYQHEDGEIGFMNSLSKSTTDVISNSEYLAWRSNSITYQVEQTENQLTNLTNILSVKQDLPWFRVTFKASHAYSESNNPNDILFNFWQQVNGGFANHGNLGHTDPTTLSNLATADPYAAVLSRVRSSNVLSKERTVNGALDLEAPFSLSSMVSGSVKFGGSMLYRTRDYDINAKDGGNYWLGGNAITAIVQKYPQYDPNQSGRIRMFPFLDASWNPNNYLGGDYPFPYSLMTQPMWDIMPIFQNENNPEYIASTRLENTFNDYGGHETKSAGFTMLTIKIGEDIKILPGVRYQNLTTNYHAMRGLSVPGGIQGGDTTVEQSHGYWLPMVHLRYTPLDWFTIHAAYTNTLNYPDYSTITPRYFIGTGVIYYNNYKINPARSENYDLVISLHSNEIGLLTVDGFKKRIKDLIFFERTYRSDFSEYPDIPLHGKALYELNTYINNPNAIDLWGIETEWQTNFWYLPKPLDGLVLNFNYTHIFSEAKYPRSEKRVFYDEEGNSVTVVSDSFYTSRLLNQPNDVINLALGYDYEGFSARVSMLYQDNIFKQPDFFVQQRVYSAKFTRWDISLKQDLPWFGIQLLFNINNLTGQRETDVNEKTLYPANVENYGMTADLGLRIRM